MIPLRSDAPVRGTPWANYALIAANLIMFFLFDAIGAKSESLLKFKNHVLALDSGQPGWWQFFSYQFLHDNLWHLAGNMLFLWVFGNSVNSKFGSIPYSLFYISAGAFAGWGFAIGQQSILVGASGSIAAITTAYMVLFPRSRILFLLWFFIITTFELPSLWVILFKIVLWDNVLAPNMASGAGEINVAHNAHLFGYFYGFIVTMAMLLFGALARDQFDLIAILKRWNQRRSYAAMMTDPQARVRAQYGTVARPIVMDPQKQREIEARLDQIANLRANVHQALADPASQRAALDYYENLMMIHPEQVLPRQQQLEIGRLFYSQSKFAQAAAAFEKYLKHFPKSKESEELRLLLGIVYARDLSQFEAAEGHLRQALDSISDASRKEQCEHWLNRVIAVLKPAAPDVG